MWNGFAATTTWPPRQNNASRRRTNWLTSSSAGAAPNSGANRRYQNLRRFLDSDFRRDLKNLSLYLWAGDISSLCKPEATEEFIVRFGQYLVERGYLRIADAPSIVQAFSSKDNARACLLLQAFLAEKLGVPPAGPMPKSLAFVADPAALQSSWDKFLSGTDAYRARLRQWEKERKLQAGCAETRPVGCGR